MRSRLANLTAKAFQREMMALREAAIRAIKAIPEEKQQDT